MWLNHQLNERIYDLTRKALHGNDDDVTRVLWEFEDIVQTTGYGLPIQKAYLLWESKKISADRLILFLEDSYKCSNELEDDAVAKRLRDEVARWTFHFLWQVTRPAR